MKSSAARKCDVNEKLPRSRWPSLQAVTSALPLAFTLSLSLSLSFFPSSVRAEFEVSKLMLLDRPFLGEQVALSPDGRFLAYTVQGDGRLSLFVAEIDRKVTRAIPLTVGQRVDRVFPRLSVLRWVGQRLVIQTAEGELASIDPDGRNATWLWSRGDNGIVNDYTGLATQSQAAPARVLPLRPSNPDGLWVEGIARMAHHRMGNLFEVNVRTGETTSVGSRAFYDSTQIAVHGPGNVIFPLPPQGDSEGSLIPPQPPDPDASSTGIMLYDRNGWPRILYEQPLTKKRRRFSYIEGGKPSLEPYITSLSLEEALGQRTRREENLGKLGEFEMRPENYFGERSYPIGFGYDPDVVYIASSVGRDTYGIYSLNLKTRERVELAPGVKGFDLAPMEPAEARDLLVFDEAKQQLAGIRFSTLRASTYWIDPELRELQLAADKLLPRYNVELASWDAERRRFILRASSEEDPGAIFIYDRAEDRLDRFSGRAPWLANTTLKSSTSFEFKTPAGVQLTGYVTLPADAKVDPPPLLIYCAPGLFDRAAPGFNREAEMLADMGLVVMRLNYRGSAGFGRAHLTAIQQGIDSVPVEDLLAAVDWLAARRPIDRKRVIVMGEGFGGYLALRAMQLHPETFRAAISVNAPTNIRAWAATRNLAQDSSFATEAAATADAEDPEAALMNPTEGNAMFLRLYDFRSLVRQEFFRDAKRGDDIGAAVAQGNFAKPVLLISNPLSGDLTSVASLLGAFGLGLEGTSVQRMSIAGDFVGGTLETRIKVFRRIEEFLNTSLYNFGSEIGELRVVQPPPAPAK